MVGLIGPDGVGKSTLMGLIAGSKKMQAGSVRVLGGDMAVAAHRDAACPRIAFMPQGLGKNLYLELASSRTSTSSPGSSACPTPTCRPHPRPA